MNVCKRKIQYFQFATHATWFSYCGVTGDLQAYRDGKRSFLISNAGKAVVQHGVKEGMWYRIPSPPEPVL